MRAGTVVPNRGLPRVPDPTFPPTDMIPFIQRLWSRPAHAYCECRHCGQSVDDDAESCPECGAADVVRYDQRVLE